MPHKPRDDTTKQTLTSVVGYICMSVVALGAVALVYMMVQLTRTQDPVLAQPVEAVVPPPVLDEAQLARAITAGVVAAIGSPAPLRGEIVMLEPTPTSTPARPTTVSTTGPMTCPQNPNVLPEGSICLGKAPYPTPTPMPACLTPPIPSVICIVRPGVIVATPAPLLPSPTPEPEGEHTR